MRKTVLIALILVLIPAGHLSAQFATGSSGGMTSSSGSPSDSSGSAVESYTLKRYFKSLSHRDTMSIGWAFGGSVLLPGTAQIYNKDYWKLPIFYPGIGGLVGGGVHYHTPFKKSGRDSVKLARSLCLLGAAAVY